VDVVKREREPPKSRTSGAKYKEGSNEIGVVLFWVIIVAIGAVEKKFGV
jgi:hypothetical protein